MTVLHKHERVAALGAVTARSGDVSIIDGLLQGPAN
jgi:hypothetical protein